ncbi:hypothetical protein DER46DRAFT_511122 [Fusarium sp. MPI-SDFR-AT-0072]|nr:hypothetical protein DER46DRAFT_511122 [Fusarium sp. MPI-SDFR-AT-0072]
MAVFDFDGNPVKIPKTACLTGCSRKNPSEQTDHAAIEAQVHRAFSSTCDWLTSAGEQLKSGSAGHSVMRELYALTLRDGIPRTRDNSRIDQHILAAGHHIP